MIKLHEIAIDILLTEAGKRKTEALVKRIIKILFYHDPELQGKVMDIVDDGGVSKIDDKLSSINYNSDVVYGAKTAKKIFNKIEEADPTKNTKYGNWIVSNYFQPEVERRD